MSLRKCETVYQYNCGILYAKNQYPLYCPFNSKWEQPTTQETHKAVPAFSAYDIKYAHLRTHQRSTTVTILIYTKIFLVRTQG